MDPNTLLDYALFQLTPTRTRCDLVVCLGVHKEKIASGLVEPFISHLKFAKDQIPKGGYSITLRPPSSDASWFTKATFQRFVRFVSTPEVLERFVRVEREIQQIESSIESNELSNTHAAAQVADGGLSAADGIIRKSTDSTKSKGESERSDDVLPEENSKIRLQRLLGTRKVLLRKEQAMAYARALAAGFQMDNIDDLISFADSFGASRLRQACIEFKDLCKKKNKDRLWMDELAAVEACAPSELSYMGTSGIILTCESGSSSQSNTVPNGSLDASSDSTASQANSDNNKDNNLLADQISSTPTKAPVQMQWANQIPQFMYNNQSPVQQMPPYQGYPFPGMIPMPPYYQGNMVWPPNIDESGHRNQKPTSRKKEKSQGVKSPNTVQEDEQTESSDSDSRSDSDSHTHARLHRKKHRKPSKTVVIRNINYITSKKRNEEKDGVSDDPSSGDDGLLNEEFLKQKVDDAVESLEKHRKKRGDHKSSSNLNGSDESDPLAKKSVEGKRNETWDAFQDILMKNELDTDGVEKQNEIMPNEDFVMNSLVDLGGEKVTVKRKVATDSFDVTKRNGGYESRVDFEDFSNGDNFRASMKNRDCADEQLLFSQRSDKSECFQEKTVLNYSADSSIIKNGKGEDWFIVENRAKSNGQTMYDGDYSLSLDHERSQTEKSKKIVPIDDSFMIQSRSTVDDQYNSQWRTEISMVSDLGLASETINGSADLSKDKVGPSGTREPDDLCVVLERDEGLSSVVASWTPEMDYGTEVSFKEVDKKLPVIEAKDQVEEKAPVKSKAVNGTTTVGPRKDARSKMVRGSHAKNSSDILSKSKKPSLPSRPVVQKSKLEKEEEVRKKMEELVIQRQKRIAERSSASGLSPASPKTLPVGSKTASLKHDKHRPQSTTKV